jgi:ubiquinone/menaquinone biosynthesis C-methylase UbiE
MKDQYFDLIICSLILHEVSEVVRIEILKEAKRILQNDGRILLIDYHPGPIKKFKGIYSKLIITFFEFLAGGEHYKNYNQFIKNGGLPSLIEKLGLKIENQKIVSGGNFGIFILRK